MFSSALRRSAFVATTALGATATAYTYSSTNRQSIKLDGVGNWEKGSQQYNDNLKINRHKQAFLETGGVPETVIHNSSSAKGDEPKAHHVADPHSIETRKTPAQVKTVTGSDSKAAKADGSEDVTKPRVENKDKKGKVGTLSGKKETGAAGGDVPEVVEEKAEEASGQQSAYNEETGEINWDCPCLGGMASGPCGTQFRAAFSCFVYSEAEPKGVECVDKFRAMQECFREHPEIYGEEQDDDEPPASPLTSTEGAPKGSPSDAASQGGRDVPKAPKKDSPPMNSPIPHQTPDNNPAKAPSRL